MEESKGVRIDIGDFGDRIRDYGHFLKDTDRGFFPFTLGKGHDYWAEMTYGLPIRLSIQKEMWYSNRGKAHHKQDTDFKTDLYEDINQKINFALTVERAQVRKIIEQE